MKILYLYCYERAQWWPVLREDELPPQTELRRPSSLIWFPEDHFKAIHLRILSSFFNSSNCSYWNCNKPCSFNSVLVVFAWGYLNKRETSQYWWGVSLAFSLSAQKDCKNARLLTLLIVSSNIYSNNIHYTSTWLNRFKTTCVYFCIGVSTKLFTYVMRLVTIEGTKRNRRTKIQCLRASNFVWCGMIKPPENCFSYTHFLK